MSRFTCLFLSAPLAVLAIGCRGTAPPTEFEPPPGETVAGPGGERTPPAQGEPASQEDPGRFLRQEAEGLRVRQERAAVLSNQYVERAKEAFDRADFKEALVQYAQALEVDPTSQAAREGLRRTEAILGERGASASEFVEDAAQLSSVRRAQARIAAEQAVLDADNAARAGRYQEAIDKYREALLILRYNPLLQTPELSEANIRQKMDEASATSEAAEREQAEQTEARARAEQERREREDRESRQTRVRALFREANGAFAAGRFAEAEALLAQILAMEPENAQAQDLLQLVVAARHESTDRDLRKRLSEEWQRTFADLDAMDVPQTETFRFDLDRWREVSAREPRQIRPVSAPEGAEEEAIRRRLAETVFPAKFDEASIEEAASFFQNLTGVNFLVSRRVREEVSAEEKTLRGIDLKSTSVAKVLDLMTELLPLGWRIRNGVVQIVHKEELKGGQVLAQYEVRDIVHPVRDFPAPEINLFGSTDQRPEAEAGEQREFLVINADKLVELIKANIAAESWTADERNTINVQNGTLVVRQTPEVQDKISSLLDDLREATGIMVDIQARFLKVQDSFLEDIGVDWRGLGDDSGGLGVPGVGSGAILDDFGSVPGSPSNPGEIGTGPDVGGFFQEGNDADLRGRAEHLFDLGLGNANILQGSGGLSVQYTLLDDTQLELILRAVTKSERVEEVTAPHLLVFNTERASLKVLNQVTYVKDFDVEIAQAAAVADPIIDVVNDGIFLDVKPVVSADRKFITMELRPTVAVLRRPILQTSTSLGVGSPVTIQLPELEIQRARTTVSIPDGSTIVLGGLKISEQQDFKSGVPLLNQIPLVSALFSRKGTFVSNRKLLILLRAKIVIPVEHEPVLAGAPNR
jgi:type II secretory pathway component GspD/PulD (secretin)